MSAENGDVEDASVADVKLHSQRRVESHLKPLIVEENSLEAVLAEVSSTVQRNAFDPVPMNRCCAREK